MVAMNTAMAIGTVAPTTTPIATTVISMVLVVMVLVVSSVSVISGGKKVWILK